MPPQQNHSTREELGMENGDTQGNKTYEENEGKRQQGKRIQGKMSYFQVRNFSEILKHKANQIVDSKRSWICHFVFAQEHLWLTNS